MNIVVYTTAMLNGLSQITLKQSYALDNFCKRQMRDRLTDKSIPL